MYTQNDFPVGSKARVIATGAIWLVSSHRSDGLIKCINLNGYTIVFNLSEIEPVFEYGEKVIAQNEGYLETEGIYSSPVHPDTNYYKEGLRHVVFTNIGVWLYQTCRASSRKSELLKQLEQAREEERQATKKREELEKELETIK